MLKKTLFALLLLLTFSSNIFARNSIKEISAGPLYLKLAYYAPLSDKSFIGANASVGLFAFFVPILEIAPAYKYYFSPEKNGSFFISSELYLQKKILFASSTVNVNSCGIGAGVGYKLYFGKNKKLFISPTVNLRVPLYHKGGYHTYGGELTEASFFKTVMNTVSLGYRF